MSKSSNDRALRIYNEVLGLDRLHYGMWLDDDELTYDNLKKAQIRYEDFLIESIPAGVKTVLDVGCGTGVLTQKLLDAGYDVEGLSPDINQKKVFTENVKAKFHHTTFGRFEPEHPYDCLIMSESAQYIIMDRLFETAKRSLKKGGFLMICDYFTIDQMSKFYKRSGHDLQIFKEKIKQSNFKIVSEENITSKVTKTLDIAKDFADRGILAVEILTEKPRIKHPYLSKFVLWFFRKKINKVDDQLQLLDSSKFIKYNAYWFMLLQVGD